MLYSSYHFTSSSKIPNSPLYPIQKDSSLIRKDHLVPVCDLCLYAPISIQFKQYFSVSICFDIGRLNFTPAAFNLRQGSINIGTRFFEVDLKKLNIKFI